MISLGAVGLGKILGAVAGLVGVGWIGEGIIKDMGYVRVSILWGIVIYIAGSVVVLKWAWDKVEDALDAFGTF